MSSQIALFAFILAVAQPLQAMSSEYLVYFGTFTDGSSKGIYVSRMDAATGRVSAPELVAEIPSPNYLSISPDGRFVFAATRPNATDGTVTAYAIERPSGRLVRINEEPAGGAGPCHVSVDPSGRTVLVANYTGGSVKSFRAAADGRLTSVSFIQNSGSSVNPSRQKGPHAHCIMPAPDGRFALACDLGTDRVMIYRLDPADGALTAHEPAFANVPPGSGPRHLVFSADGTRIHVVNEMTCTLTTFTWDEARGLLDAPETIPLLPPDVGVEASFSAAAIVASPDGRFVYATVRGHNSVSVFAANTDGRLSLVENVPCGGQTPRGLGIDPTGRWLLVGNQRSNTVNAFAIDAATGRLSATDQVIDVGSPVDVRFVAADPLKRP